MFKQYKNRWHWPVVTSLEVSLFLYLRIGTMSVIRHLSRKKS